MSEPLSPRYPTSRQEIAGVSVASLAKEFGTPLYVYDLNRISKRIKDLARFDVVRYAQKACSNLAILDRMRRKGAVVDAVSCGEIDRALHVGFEPAAREIVYTADVFDRESLDRVVAKSIHVNCGSPDMISQLGARSPGADITLRINPGFGHGHSQKTNTGGEHSKHGIWHTQIVDCLRRADQFGLTVTGLHMHIGSGTDLEHLSRVCGAMEQAAIEVGRTITTISAGGGLPIPYRDRDTVIDLDSYFQLWDEMRTRLTREFGHGVKLEVEPGRYLVAEAGFLVAEVRGVKQMGDHLYFLVDAGFNDLVRPAMYGAYHPISICGSDGTPTDDRQRVPAVVGGPLCESGDVFTQKEGGWVETRELPMCRVGDCVIFECAGAYGFAMSSNYNSKLRPAEVMIEDGSVKLIRRRERFQGLIQDELIPE